MNACSVHECTTEARWVVGSAALCRRHMIDAVTAGSMPARILPAQDRRDIVDRLRGEIAWEADVGELLAEAADEIERLRGVVAEASK